MKLSQLEPKFVGAPYFDDEGRESFTRVDTIEEAAGIRFLCPVCFEKNGGRVGTHGIVCWDGTVSQDFLPKPGRWNMSGTGFDDLTLTGATSSNSVFLKGASCGAHFFVINGLIE